MKPNPKMLFGNIFDDRNITPSYLARFTDDVIAKLTQNNTGGVYDTFFYRCKLQLFRFVLNLDK